VSNATPIEITTPAAATIHQRLANNQLFSCPIGVVTNNSC
jgi:hypothetical protein